MRPLGKIKEAAVDDWSSEKEARPISPAGPMDGAKDKPPAMNLAMRKGHVSGRRPGWGQAAAQLLTKKKGWKGSHQQEGRGEKSCLVALWEGTWAQASATHIKIMGWHLPAMCYV